MANTEALIGQAYSAFNRRDIDSALAMPTAARPAVIGSLTVSLHVLADFISGTDDALSGMLVFEQNGVLAGREVYGLTGGPSFCHRSKRRGQFEMK